MLRIFPVNHQHILYVHSMNGESAGAEANVAASLNCGIDFNHVFNSCQMISGMPPLMMFHIGYMGYVA